MSKINLPIVFSQMDSRWANVLLGFNTQQPYNFYNYACLLSCWAMIDCYYGKDIDPLRLNDIYKKMGVGKAFTANSGDYVPGGNNLAYGDIKETRTVTPSPLNDTQLGEIRTAIDNGYPVIFGIDVNPKTVAFDSHFVVVIDYNPSDENDFTIADPIGGKIHSLKDYLGWFVPSVRKTVYSYIITSGPKPKVTSDTIVISKDHYDLYLRNHDQWHKLVHYLKPDADPNGTLFEDMQTVIAGIKSRQTDLENQLATAIQDKNLAEQEVINQKDKLANSEDECQREQKLQKAEFDALKATVPDIEKLRGQYTGTIDDLQGKLTEAQKQIGLRDLTIKQLSGEVSANNILQKIFDFIRKLH